MEWKSGSTTYRLWLHLLQFALLRDVKFWTKNPRALEQYGLCLIRLTFHLHKTAKTVATRHVFWAQKSKYTENAFVAAALPEPAGGAYSEWSPDPIAGFKGPLCSRGWRKGKGRGGGNEREGKGAGREERQGREKDGWGEGEGLRHGCWGRWMPLTLAFLDGGWQCKCPSHFPLIIRNPLSLNAHIQCICWAWSISICKSQTFSVEGLCPSLRPFPTHGCSTVSRPNSLWHTSMLFVVRDVQNLVSFEVKTVHKKCNRKHYWKASVPFTKVKHFLERGPRLLPTHSCSTGPPHFETSTHLCEEGQKTRK